MIYYTTSLCHFLLEGYSVQQTRCEGAFTHIVYFGREQWIQAWGNHVKESTQQVMCLLCETSDETIAGYFVSSLSPSST